MLAPQADFLSVSGDAATPALPLLPLRQGGCCESGREIELPRVRGKRMQADFLTGRTPRGVFLCPLGIREPTTRCESPPIFRFLDSRLPWSTSGEVCEQAAPDPRLSTIDARQMSSPTGNPSFDWASPVPYVLLLSSQISPCTLLRNFSKPCQNPDTSVPIAHLAPFRRTTTSLDMPLELYIIPSYPLSTPKPPKTTHFQLLQSRKTSTGLKV